MRISSSAKRRSMKNKKKRSKKHAKKYRGSWMGGAENAECPVCQEAFNTGDEIASCNKCHNLIHGDCIRQWCAGKLYCPCPFCRANNTFQLYPPGAGAAATPIAQVTPAIEPVANGTRRTRRNGRHRHVESPPRSTYYNQLRGLVWP